MARCAFLLAAAVISPHLAVTEQAPAPKLCADTEGKDCACKGDVYYALKFFGGKPGAGRVATFDEGKAKTYKKKTVDGSIKCNAAAFGGDPLPGYYKQCFCVLPAVVAVSVAAAPAPASGVSAGANKKIKMVTETLKDILQSVSNEEKTETTLYNKYMSWCKSEGDDIAKNLKDARTDLSNARVLSQEQVSTIDNLKLFITKSTKEIEDTNDAVAQAVSLRTSENEKYTEELQINTQSLRQIDLAIKHVGKVNKQGGFLQNGVIKKLQVNQPGESSYVLGIMKGLKDKLDKSRKLLQTTETDKVKMHDSFMATKSASLKALGDKLTEKKILNSETVAKEAGVKQKITKLVDEVAKLVKAAADTTDSCQTTSAEWKVRQADRTKEKAALNEAVRFLTETSLEQISMVQQSTEDQNDASVVFAPNFLQEAISSKISDNEFYKAADAALMGEDDEVQGHLKKDTFNGVKSVVQKLIGSHADTQKEEKDKKNYCNKEIESKEDEKDTTVDDLADVSANIDKKTSEVATLKSEVTKLEAAIVKARKSVVDAGKLRQEENTAFAAGTKDRALAIKVLNQAMSVLQSFYDKSKGNLLQAGEEQPPAAPPRGAARKSTASFGAVSMVQDIADDIAKEQKDAAMQEKEAATAYAQLQKGTQQANDDRQQDITDRVMAKAKLGVQINTLKETKTEKQNDLEAVNKQIAALHQECDELLQFYDKRVKSRTFEVSQLRDVMDILSGSSIAARTGLMQDSDVEAAYEQDGDAADDNRAEPETDA